MVEENVNNETGDIGVLLKRIDQRLQRLEEALGPVATLSSQANAVTATLADIIDDKADKLGDGEERLVQLRSAMETLTHPKTLKSLQSMLKMADEIPNLVSTLSDIVDTSVQALAKEGVDVDRMPDFLIRLLKQLTIVAASPTAEDVLAMLDTKTLSILGNFAKSFSVTAENIPPKVGPWGMYRKLKNPDIQRSLGFVMELTGRFGQFLKNDKQLSAGK